MPLYGVLQPGETQRFSFSFYAHTGISVQGRAICKVEGGPDYFVDLSGGANVISYQLDTEPIKFEHQVIQLKVLLHLDPLSQLLSFSPSTKFVLRLCNW